MRGQILGVDVRTGEGQLAGDDGRRYAFRPDDWAHQGEPAIGLPVDFEPEDNRARSIFPLPGATTALATAPQPYFLPTRRRARRSDRNKVVAALLAFFLGMLGLHRFYLGRTGTGILMLVMTLTAVGAVITLPWSIIDAIRYLLMTNRDFERRYELD